MKTIREVMDMPIENLEISVRCMNCLKNMNIKTLSQLTAKKEEDFYKVTDYLTTFFNHFRYIFFSKKTLYFMFFRRVTFLHLGTTGGKRAFGVLLRGAGRTTTSIASGTST